MTSSTEQLVRDYHHVMVHVAWTTGLTVQQAQDAAQDTWASYLTTDVGHPRSWLYIAARNRAHSIWRHDRKQEPTGLLPARDERAVDPETAAGRAVLWAAVAALPCQQRRWAVLYAYGYSEAAIAAALGISRGTVKNHGHRARTALRARLEGTW